MRLREKPVSRKEDLCLPRTPGPETQPPPQRSRKYVCCDAGLCKGVLSPSAAKAYENRTGYDSRSYMSRKEKLSLGRSSLRSVFSNKAGGIYLLKLLVLLSTVVLLIAVTQLHVALHLYRVFVRSFGRISVWTLLAFLLTLYLMNLGLFAATVRGFDWLTPTWELRQRLATGYFSAVICAALISGIFLLIQMFFLVTKLRRGDAPCVRQTSRQSANLGDEKTAAHPAPVQSPSTCIHANPTRRVFLKASTVVGIGSVLGVAHVGLSEAFGPQNRADYDVFHPSLGGMPGSIDIIQITDVHFAWFFGPAQLDALVDTVNSIEADALVITGDLFHSPFTPVETGIPILRRLRRRPMGSYAILGNHEFYVGARRSMAAFEAAGLTHLSDGWITWQKSGGALHLGGLDDALSEWSMERDHDLFEPFVQRTPQSPGFKLCICHRPSIFPMAAHAKFDLTLTGHVHGGQLLAPIAGTGVELTPARLLSRYTHGWYTEGDSRMYLNRGTGLIYAPWRLNCPPEIAVFHLKGGPDYAVKPSAMIT